MTLQLNTPSGGSVSVEPQDTSETKTLVAPATDGQIIAATGVFNDGDILQYDGGVWAPTQINSEDIKPALNATGDAPIYACRAWVNFDGTKDENGADSTANTPRFIRGRGNVSSVLRNGAGDYTITFIIPMPDAYFSLIGTASAINTGVSAAGSNKEAFFSIYASSPLSASSARFRTNHHGGDGQYGSPPSDKVFICAAIFR